MRDGVHVKLLIVDGIIESPKTARMTDGMPREALVRQDDVVDGGPVSREPVGPRA